MKIQSNVSPSRRALRDAISEKGKLEAACDKARERLQKLQEVADAVVPSIEAELAALDAREADAMAAWLHRGAEGPPPQPDVAARAEIEARLSAARQQARAAQAAMSGPQSDLERANGALGVGHRAVWLAHKAVLADELESLLPELAARIAAVEEWRARIGVARDELLAELGPQMTDARDVFVRLEGIDRRLGEASARPARTDGDRDAWRRLAGQLMTDASAEIVDDGAVDLPRPPVAPPRPFITSPIADDGFADVRAAVKW